MKEGRGQGGGKETLNDVKKREERQDCRRRGVRGWCVSGRGFSSVRIFSVDTENSNALLCNCSEKSLTFFEGVRDSPGSIRQIFLYPFGYSYNRCLLPSFPLETLMLQGASKFQREG